MMRLLPNIHPIMQLFFADILATLIVYLGSSLLGNASVYDPYWSVAPLLFIPFWFFQVEQNPFSLLFQNGYVRPLLTSLVIFFWGIRLTANWIREFTDLSYEDWRYRNFREKSPKFFWLINLTGIQLFPTILVFLGSLSLYPALTVFDHSFNLFDVLGLIITIGATLLELIADNQMWHYRQNRTKDQPIINTGLWIRTRHPNYLGEISFWWGLYFLGIGASLQYWWMIIGPISITLLFVFVSIPMIEKNQENRKPAYKKYKEEVPMLIPRMGKRTK